MLSLYNAKTLARTKAAETGNDYVVVFNMRTEKYSVMSYYSWSNNPSYNNYECLYAPDGSCHN